MAEAHSREIRADLPVTPSGTPAPSSLRELEEAQARLAAIVNASDDAIISQRLDGVIVTWNSGAERMFGYAAGTVIGQPIQLLFPPERAGDETEILRRVARGESVQDFDAVRVRKDGQHISVAATISPIKDAAGQVVGAAKILRDITERKNVERELIATLAELKDIKAALDEHSIVAITDAAGRITYVNDKFCAISKYAREELLGRDHRIINSRFHGRDFFRELWGTIARGEVWHGEIRNRAKDGTLYWVDTTIFPRMNATGKPTQYVAIRTDITQRKADELALQSLATDLAEKNKELETIVYTVSHDLRSPLVNVQGFSKQLNRAWEKIIAELAATPDGQLPANALVPVLKETIPQALRFINAGIAKMDMLLAGLLRYSRLGRITLTIKPLEMNALMAGVLAAMNFQLNEAKAEVVVSELPPCLGDSTQTSQVFANLLDNALKYRSHDRPLRIRVSGRVISGQAIYEVVDNGVGIAAEHQTRIFELFHRLNPGETAGEGLGLAIAQRVLERQHGHVRVESVEGEGSTFYVSLPTPRP